MLLRAAGRAALLGAGYAEVAYCKWVMRSKIAAERERVCVALMHKINRLQALRLQAIV